MKRPRGIASDACITINGDCAMQCEVLENQVEVRFGDDETGLHLFFDSLGLLRFMRLLDHHGWLSGVSGIIEP